MANKNHFAYFETGLFKWLYEKFRYPFAPMYGGFPVKLRTFLGDPIPYDPKITAEELAEKVICVFFISLSTDFILIIWNVIVYVLYARVLQQWFCPIGDILLTWKSVGGGD